MSSPPKWSSLLLDKCTNFETQFLVRCLTTNFYPSLEKSQLLWAPNLACRLLTFMWYFLPVNRSTINKLWLTNETLRRQYVWFCPWIIYCLTDWATIAVSHEYLPFRITRFYQSSSFFYNCRFKCSWGVNTPKNALYMYLNCKVYIN